MITEEKYAYRTFFFRDHETDGFWMVHLEHDGEKGEGCGARGAREGRAAGHEVPRRGTGIVSGPAVTISPPDAAPGSTLNRPGEGQQPGAAGRNGRSDGPVRNIHGCAAGRDTPG